MLQNYSGYRVLRAFMKKPLEGFGLRGLCKEIKLGPSSVLSYLETLISEGLVVGKKLYGRKLYFANRESRIFRLYKQFETSLQIEASGLLKFIDEKLGFPTIILFGSKAVGEDTEKSDMDIAVIASSKKELNVESFEEKLGCKVHLLILTDKDFDNMKTANKELLNNIVNGKGLSGYMKVV